MEGKLVLNHKGHEGTLRAFSEIPNLRVVLVRDLYDVERPIATP